jgi:hypothetical protein
VPLVEFLEREVLVLVVFAVYCAVVLAALPQELVQDSWLTLVSGREVFEHGLPERDRLTVWSAGARWVDQQWGAQLAFYSLYLLGGLKLVMLTHAGLLGSAFGAGLAAGRRRGASAKSVALVGAVTMLLAPWALQMRAQSLAMPFFVLVVWLLAADSRRPSSRVYLVLPLLVLWANVHGTVVLGAGLVALRGVTVAAGGLRGREGAPWKLRAALLIAAPWPCLLASPYGLDLVGYYVQMLLDPTLRGFVHEWGPSQLSARTAPFYLLAFASVWLVARHGERLTGFERAALLVALAGGITAIRSIVWFALAALVLLPPAVDGALASRPARRLGVRRALAVVALAGVLAAALAVATRPPEWYTREWPGTAARVVADASGRAPGLRVLADDRHADWLLWENPEIAGRVAYDVRFELLSRAQLRWLFEYRNRVGDRWRQASDGYGLVTVDRTTSQDDGQRLFGEPAARLLYRDERISVFLRTVESTAAVVHAELPDAGSSVREGLPTRLP